MRVASTGHAIWCGGCPCRLRARDARIRGRRRGGSALNSARPASSGSRRSPGGDLGGGLRGCREKSDKGWESLLITARTTKQSLPRKAGKNILPQDHRKYLQLWRPQPISQSRPVIGGMGPMQRRGKVGAEKITEGTENIVKLKCKSPTFALCRGNAPAWRVRQEALVPASAGHARRRACRRSDKERAARMERPLRVAEHDIKVAKACSAKHRTALEFLATPGQAPPPFLQARSGNHHRGTRCRPAGSERVEGFFTREALPQCTICKDGGKGWRTRCT